MKNFIYSPNYFLSTCKLSFKNLFKVQRYLYKSVYVNDMGKALAFQKLIMASNSVRLLSIREVTQLDAKKHISGVDGLICSSFLERFKLNELLKSNVNNWFPSVIRHVTIVKKTGESYFLDLPTILDRCWYCLVQFCLEPAHEAVFNLRNFGFRPYVSIDKVYKSFCYNLNEPSFGKQKRILNIDLEACFVSINVHYLLKKVILPRSIKLGIFRGLNLGLKLAFPSFYSTSYELTAVLANIILDGIELISPSIRFGYFIVFFLKPFDNELKLFTKIERFLFHCGLNFKFLKCQVSSTLVGFNFLYWNFRILPSGEFLCLPSFQSYKDFFLRIKNIINNSNYGAVCF